MKRTILILFASLLCVFAQAQKENFTQTIRGIVVDADNEQPIPGASIVLIDSNPQIGTSTDLNGEFKLENVPLGRKSINVSGIGYNPSRISNLNLEVGKEIVLTISLKEQIIVSEEVVVTGKSQKNQAHNEMAVISARSFSIEETEKYAGSLGDPSRMASNFAGVMSVSDQRNDIIIRGNSPIGLLWRIDDIDVPNPNHFGALGTTGGPVSMLNNNLLANSDFFTGAFPAQYGNATSGVFDLKMRTGNNNKREYVGQIGFNGFEIGAEGPFSKKSKASYLVNFRYSTLEVMNKLGMDFGTGASIPQYKDLSFKINVPMKKGKFSMFGIGGVSYIELLNKDTTEASYGTSQTNTYFGSDMGVVGVSYLHFLSENTRLQVNFSSQYALSKTKLDSIQLDKTIMPYFRNNLKEMKSGISLTLRSKLDKKNNISFGLTTDYYNFNFCDSVVRSKSDYLPNPALNTPFITLSKIKGNFILIQGFGELQHRFNEKITLYTGAHFQEFTLNNNYTIEPRISLRWNFLSKQSINIGAGMHSQLQPHTLYFIKTEYADGTTAETNKNLDFTKSNQAVLGYDLTPSEFFRIKVETYYQQLYNVPVSASEKTYSAVNEGAGFGISQVDSLTNMGKGTNVGVELTIEKFLHNNYYFLVTTSVFDSKYKDFYGFERNTAFNGNYVFNALAGYEFKIGKKNSLSIDLRGVWAGGMRQIPVLLNESIAKHEQVNDYSNAYKNRNEDYKKVDLRISFKMNMKHISQEWAIDIQNLTNNKNEFRSFFNSSTNKIQTDYQNAIYPMFLYRIRF